jgi:hypothetical protein
MGKMCGQKMNTSKHSFVMTYFMTSAKPIPTIQIKPDFLFLKKILPPNLFNAFSSPRNPQTKLYGHFHHAEIRPQIRIACFQVREMHPPWCRTLLVLKVSEALS